MGFGYDLAMGFGSISLRMVVPRDLRRNPMGFDLNLNQTLPARFHRWDQFPDDLGIRF